MRREGRRDENHLLETEGFPNLFRPPQMTHMDGIEGAAKEPYFPFTLCLDFEVLLLVKMSNDKVQSSN
jgi:hypothetical protein